MADESSGQRKNKWEVVDDDVMVKDQPQTVITLSSDDDEDDSDIEGLKPKINKNMTMDQRQTLIKQEIMDESIDLCDDDIELIDDEYDDSLSAAAELADTSVIDEFFGEDTLLKEFKRENDCKPSSSRHKMDPDSDIITCPICQGKMTRAVFADHLNGCTGITRKILPPKTALKKLAATSKEARPQRRPRPSASTTRDILRNAGYSESDLAQIHSASSMDEDDEEEDEFLRRSGVSRRSTNNTKKSSPQELNSSSEDENTRRSRMRSVYKTTRQCPVCAKEVEESEMNIHLDVCLM